MNIGVLSDTRLPSLPFGPHGLGRAAGDIANSLAQLGHDVTLYGGKGSTWGGAVVEHSNETQRAHVLDNAHDAWVDISHYHDLNNIHPEWPVVHYILDLECPYTPANACVNTTHARKTFQNARIVPLGIDVDAIPPGCGARDYLTFCAKIHPHKGYDLALRIANTVTMPVYFVGEKFVPDAIPNYRGVIGNASEFYDWLGGAAGLLSPYRKDAGGRVNLEAAACGTPTLCLDGVATAEHVAHCVSGFICADVDEMIDAVQDLPLLEAERMRNWVQETHGLLAMGRQLAAACEAVVSGERW
jgi:glycosyltransferase involved in cell wall biosynthesis